MPIQTIPRWLALFLTLLMGAVRLASAGHAALACAPIPRGTSLGPTASPVENLSWKVGRAVLSLKQGTATEIRADNRLVGYYLKGEGSLDYTSTFVTEFPVLSFNSKEQKGPEVRGNGLDRQLTVAWTEASVFLAGLEFPRVAKLGAVADAEAYFKHRAFFDIRVEDPLGHKLAWWAQNNPSGSLARIELRKNGKGFVYELDQVRNHTESLIAVSPDSFGSIKWMRSYTLSIQPAEGRTRLHVPTPLVLTHLDLDLRASDNHQANLTVQEELSLTEPTRLLLFDMVTSRIGETPLGGAVRRPIDVKRVVTAEGVDLEFDHRDNQLAVLLPKRMESGEVLKLVFEIEGGLLSRHGGDRYWELGIFPWFPQPPLEGQNYTLHATARVPKPFILLMSGDVIRRENDKEYNLLETRLEKPICFFSIAAGQYSIREFVKDGITVRLAGYAGLGVSAERLAKTAHGIINFYQAILGKFPVNELNIIERKELGHGQAPPGIIWITSEAFNPTGNDLNRMYAAAWINQGLAHEIAHQYWGINVKMATLEDQWITESFAEYSSALAMVAMKGKGEDKYKIIVRNWQERAKKAHGASSIPMANRLAPDEMSIDESRFRQDLIYFKGSTILHALHCEIGDAAFRKWLWLLQSNLGGRAVVTADILPTLQYVARRDFAPFLEKCYWGTDLPSFPKNPMPPR